MQRFREEYEKEVIRFLYYHNPHSAEEGCPKGDYCVGHEYRQFYFWLSYHHSGDFDGSCLSDPQLKLIKPEGENINIADVIGENFGMNNLILNTGTIPAYTYEKLARPWDALCGNDTGVVLVNDFGENDEKFCPEKYLRFTERARYSSLLRVGGVTKEIGEKNKFHFEIIMDLRPFTKASAVRNIIQTIFICLVLGGGALFFSKDANDLVLRPIERMAEKMEKLRMNPLYATRLEEDEHKQELAEKMKLKMEISNAKNPVTRWRVKRKMMKLYNKNGGKVEPLETVILEKTIIKIGGLLAVGFGEAGAEVISHNIRGGSAAVNPMVAGSRVEAILGFCDIRQFNIATEVLQDDIMIFVNQIGEIVHGIVDDFHGVANRNLGEAFLMVWRLPSSEVEEMDAEIAKKRQKLADMSVMAFVKILVAINKSPVLGEYRNHPGLFGRLGDAYKVSMGFGLHVGWAIEGAIGSKFKIDASYLSPNVNMASRLAAATKQYGTNILCSEALIRNMCSENMRKYGRVIDNVMVKGSKVPVRLYTVDIDVQSLEVADLEKMDINLRNAISRSSSLARSNLGDFTLGRFGSFVSSNGSLVDYNVRIMDIMKRKKTRSATRKRTGSISGAFATPSFFGINNRLIKKSKLRQIRETRKAKKWDENFVVANLWEEDEDLILVRKIFTEEFLTKFGKAYKNYEAGEWEKAAKILNETKEALGYEDGPSMVLLKFIQSYGCTPPRSWKGYRALTEK